jgi:hypothetical protein
MNVPRPPQARQVGYGLPCAKCRRYFSADLDACPICNGRDRVSPVVAPARTPPGTQTPVEPILIPSSVPPQRDRSPEESRSALFDQEEFSVQQVCNSLTLSGLQDRHLAETKPAAAAKLPETQGSVDPILSVASLVQQPEELPTRLECPRSTEPEDVVAQQKTDTLPIFNGVGDCQASDAELDAVHALRQPPALDPTPTTVSLEQERQELSKEVPSPMVAAQQEIAAKEETCLSPAVTGLQDRHSSEEPGTSCERVTIRPQPHVDVCDQHIEPTEVANKVCHDAESSSEPPLKNQGARVPRFADASYALPSVPQLDECDAADWETGGSESAPPLPELTGSNSGRQFEVLTIVLAVLVLVCAVFMSVLVGLRLTGHHSMPRSTPKTASAEGTAGPSAAALPTPRLTASTQ